MGDSHQLRLRRSVSTSGAKLPDSMSPLLRVTEEPSDPDIVAAVLSGEVGRFEELVVRYQSRLFSTARRYARHEREVEDIVQEVLIKAYSKLSTWRGDAPFEHWLMRLAVRTCYDALRVHQRNREQSITDLTEDEKSWLERQSAKPEGESSEFTAAHQLVHRILEQLSPAHRLVLTLLELEERSVREIADLTGWSIPLVKVRAFRARAEMRKILSRMKVEKYL